MQYVDGISHCCRTVAVVGIYLKRVGVILDAEFLLLEPVFHYFQSEFAAYT